MMSSSCRRNVMNIFRQTFRLVGVMVLALVATGADLPASTPAPFPQIITDGAGRVVKILAAPQCIVSLSPAATDMLELALGAHAAVVGVTRYCRIPAADEKRVVRVGGVLDPNYERILSLKPDLVIAPMLADSSMRDKLISLGLTVVVLHPEGLPGVIDDIRLLGRATGHPAEAAAAATNIENIRALAASRWQSVPEKQRPRVLVRMGDVCPAPGSYVDDLIAVAGGRNVLPRGPKAWVQVSPESMLQFAPDVVVTIRSSDDVSPSPASDKSAPYRSVTISAGDDFYRPGPSVGGALWELARVLDPVRFPEASPPADLAAP
jgi:iron complex transport system substrate-binding protein